MKVILLDTNIVLDFALKRDDFGEHAKKLFLFVNKNQVKSYIVLARKVQFLRYALSENSHLRK